MSEAHVEQIRQQLDDIYRMESRRIFATLLRLLGDFDLAEDALHDAFRVALEQWPSKGIPDNPRTWLISTGRFKTIDRLRRRDRFDGLLGEIADQFTSESPNEIVIDDQTIADDQLRLIFICCHPALSADTRVALALRELCGLTTEAIAHAYFVAPSTLAQRIVRAKAKIRKAAIPYEVPAPAELPARLDAVLQVIYLIFNEGYSASSGDSVTRSDLSAESIRLGRLLVELLPETEAIGLLGLMLLHEARRTARTTPDGELILLENQDRTRWKRELIGEGVALVERALSAEKIGLYTLQAAIAATHAVAPTFAATNWRQIVGWYDLMLQAAPSPIIELNRAIAVAMQDNPLNGLLLVEEILARGDLQDYHLAHAAHADLSRQLGRTAQARRSYQRALDLTEQAPERRFLEQRLRDLTD